MEYVKTSRKKPQKYKTKKSGRKKCIKRKKKQSAAGNILSLLESSYPKIQLSIAKHQYCNT